MVTERETVQKLIDGGPESIPNLFHRHGALFREALLRFYGSTGLDQVNSLTCAVNNVVALLQRDQTDDLQETFYDWIFRRTWCTFMYMKLEGKEGEHPLPETIFDCTSSHYAGDIPDKIRKECNAHVAVCRLCNGFSENCKGIPIEVRHAGAVPPEEFEPVIAEVIKKICGSSE